MSQRLSLALCTLCWLLFAGLLGGCAPIPTPLAPPSAPTDAATRAAITTPAKELALQRADLPAGFELAGDRSAGPEYVALYLRPAALDPAASGGSTLLSVMTTVGVYTTTVAAEQAYAGAKELPGEQTLREQGLASEATDVRSERYDGAAQGTDASEAFRVQYKLMDQFVYEYGHRFRIGNVIAHVVVAAVGRPEEPPALRENTRDLVQRQIERITGR